MRDIREPGWKIPEWAIEKRRANDERERREGVNYSKVRIYSEAENAEYERRMAETMRRLRERDMFERSALLAVELDEAGAGVAVLVRPDGRLIRARVKRGVPGMVR